MPTLETPEFVSVTRDGRTLVDANKLFETKEVKEFIESVKQAYEGNLTVVRRHSGKRRPGQSRRKARSIR